MKTKLTVNVVIFLNVPDGKHSFWVIKWGVKTKIIAVEQVFEKILVEPVKIGSIMTINLHNNVQSLPSSIKMSPMLVIKGEAGERMQWVSTSLCIDETKLFPKPHLTTSDEIIYLISNILNNMEKKGFSPVGDTRERSATEIEKISLYETY
jgi:hypothetical protein